MWFRVRCQKLKEVKFRVAKSDLSPSPDLVEQRAPLHNKQTQVAVPRGVDDQTPLFGEQHLILSDITSNFTHTLCLPTSASQRDASHSARASSSEAPSRSTISWDDSSPTGGDELSNGLDKLESEEPASCDVHKIIIGVGQWCRKVP